MSNVYVYDITIEDVYSEEDFGFISSSPSVTEDNGQISTPVSSTDDWFSITSTETQIPFGSIGTISGTAEEKSSNVYNSDTLLIELTETILDNITFVWVGNGTLFEIGNGLERTLRPYVSSGTLRIGDSSEAVVNFVISPNTIGLATVSGTALEKEVDNYIGFGTITLSQELLPPNIDYTPAYSAEGSISIFGESIEKSIDSHVGSGLLNLSGSSLEVYSANTPEDTQLFSISGTSLEVYSANTPEDTQLFNISGSSLERTADSHVGLGVLEIYGNSIERSVDSYVGSGLLNLIGSSLEVYSANTPEDTQLFSIFGELIEKSTDSYVGLGTLEIYGELIHPNIDYTPHYGIDKNIGIGTTGIKLSGESTTVNVDSYVGFGTLFKFGEKFESTTYVYDESSILFFDIIDYGFIGETPDDLDEDFDSISSLSAGSIDYGFIVGLGATETLLPFGSISLVGSASESFGITTYFGSGLISISGFSLDREIQVYGQDYLTEGTLIISGDSVEKSIDSYVGSGTINLTGSALQSYSAQTPEDTQLFSISGEIVEKVLYNTPEDTQLFTISGEITEKSTDSYVGLGTLIISGDSVEKSIDSYVGLGIINLTGSALESYSAQTPEDTQLFSISGLGLEAYSAQTPEDTQLFTISGEITEKSTDSYVGLGSIVLSGSSIEKVLYDTPEDTQLFQIQGQGSYNLNLEYKTTETPSPIVIFGQPLVHPFVDYTPHYGIDKNIGIGTTGIQFQIGVGFEPDNDGNPRDAKTYSNRYPINDSNFGSGIGTITFDQVNNLARYSPLTPYTGTGLFDIVSGFSPQESYPWLPGPGVGRSWSFTRTTYISSGSASISGISSNREIDVYGYYGDDRDPGTSGKITISQQSSPIIEKQSYSYFGSGTQILSGNANLTRLNSYFGFGSITLFGVGLDSYSANTPEDTQLFNISGTSLEVYSAQTPEIEVLYIISGTIVERKTNSYEGSGSLSLNGSARTIEVPNYPSAGVIRFVTHTVDNIYDTCDNEEIVSDYQNSANIRFVANPVENDILFEIGGISSTRVISTYQYAGLETYVLSGYFDNLRLTHSEVGVGTIFTISSGFESESEVYVGFGNLFGFSGSSQSYSTQIPESTILLNISGFAESYLESQYSVVGIGQFQFFGSADTEKITVFSEVGSGSIALFGELVYPDVIFIPSQTGTGFINIIGSSDNSLTKIYSETSGTLFGFSSGFESFGRTTYIGIGTIYIQESSSEIINKPFQIPRSYVVII
jgi:hypothetical protein